MSNNLKKLAQIGLVMAVILRFAGLVELNYQTYLFVFGLATVAVLIKERKSMHLQDKVYLGGYALILLVPYGEASGIREYSLITSGLIAASAYALTQNIWGMRWPLELAGEARGLARQLKSKKSSAKKATHEVEFEKAGDYTIREIEAKPVLFEEPDAELDKISALNSHGGKPFGAIKQALVKAGNEEAKKDIFGALNDAKKGDLGALTDALLAIESHLGSSFLREFEQEFLAA
jgi:hypothetical protein